MNEKTILTSFNFCFRHQNQRKNTKSKSERNKLYSNICDKHGVPNFLEEQFKYSWMKESTPKQDSGGCQKTNSRHQSPTWKVNDYWGGQELLAIYGPIRSSTKITREHQWTLPLAKINLFHITLNFSMVLLILLSHLFLHLPSGHFPPVFLTSFLPHLLDACMLRVLHVLPFSPSWIWTCNRVWRSAQIMR